MTASESQRSDNIAEKLSGCESLQEIFELVKEAVWKILRIDQAGLMLGLAELGIAANGVLGAYYSPEANTIVMNKTVMAHLKKLSNEQIYRSYCFYILLHEYLHSCGFYDENQNRQIVAAIAAQEFGQGHPVTKLATVPEAMIGLIKGASVQPPGLSDIEFVEGIDRSNTNYIS